jgi:hypothetical protein
MPFPKPYKDDVPREGSEPIMEYVPFDKLDIGARSSGLPKGGTNNVKSLEHEGKTTGGRK